jgi:hypothetical protein
MFSLVAASGRKRSENQGGLEQRKPNKTFSILHGQYGVFDGRQVRVVAYVSLLALSRLAP